jgi:ribosomal protein L37AE/L43A
LRKPIGINEIKTKIYKIHGNAIELLEYINTKSLATFKCNICRNEWKTIANIVLFKDAGCPKCAKINRGISIRINLDEAKDRIYKKHGNKIEIIEYNKAHGPAKFKCNICGNKWNVKQAQFVWTSNGCPECAKTNNKINFNEAKNKTYKIHNNKIELLEYINVNSNAKFKCVICGNQWTANPSNVWNGQGCHKCLLQNRLLEKINKLKNNIYEKYNEKIELIEYVDNNIKLKCNVRNNEWKRSYRYSIDKEIYCPKCVKRKKIEIKEKEINEYKCKECGEIFIQRPDNGISLCPNCKNKLTYKKRKNKLAKLRKFIRIEVLEHYGNKCTCCGETINDFLTMHHKNNNGAEHRKN